MGTDQFQQWPGESGWSCSADYIRLAQTPLVRRAPVGFAVASGGEIAALLHAAYRRLIDPEPLQRALAVAVEALEAGDPDRAGAAVSSLGLPDLDPLSRQRLNGAQAALAERPPPDSEDWLVPLGKAGQKMLKSEFDDLGPGGYAVRVWGFGDWLKHRDSALSAHERAQAEARFSYQLDRLNFWFSYRDKTPEAVPRLIGATYALYQGGLAAGLVDPTTPDWPAFMDNCGLASLVNSEYGPLSQPFGAVEMLRTIIRSDREFEALNAALAASPDSDFGQRQTLSDRLGRWMRRISRFFAGKV